jgi:hypothetical protein
MRLVLLSFVLLLLAGCTIAPAEPPPAAPVLPPFMEFDTPIACQFMTGNYIGFIPRSTEEGWIYVTDMEGHPDETPPTAWVNPAAIVYCGVPEEN